MYLVVSSSSDEGSSWSLLADVKSYSILLLNVEPREIIGLVLHSLADTVDVVGLGHHSRNMEMLISHFE